MALESKDRDRLEKLLNMLGSPNEGEIGNAGRMIQKMAERYNVTPAVLCLGNPQPQKDPFPGEEDINSFRQRHRQSYGTGFQSGGFTGRSWGDWREQERARQREEDRQAQERRNQSYHEEREAELRAAGERMAREKAKKAGRRPRNWSGSYFGNLGRLKSIYDNQFERLESYQLDFIELVLDNCKADRNLTRRQLDMAKVIIKEYNEAEPLV